MNMAVSFSKDDNSYRPNRGAIREYAAVASERKNPGSLLRFGLWLGLVFPTPQSRKPVHVLLKLMEHGAVYPDGNWEDSEDYI